MCASPLSPRHAQPDWMGGGLVSRQMMHAPPSAAISFLFVSNREGPTQGKSRFGSESLEICRAHHTRSGGGMELGYLIGAPSTPPGVSLCSFPHVPF